MDTGLVAQGEGWFVLNACDARWRDREGRGKSLPFEGAADFPQVGVTLFVLDPGEPIGMYTGRPTRRTSSSSPERRCSSSRAGSKRFVSGTSSTVPPGRRT